MTTPMTDRPDDSPQAAEGAGDHALVGGQRRYAERTQECVDLRVRLASAEAAIAARDALLDEGARVACEQHWPRKSDPGCADWCPTCGEDWPCPTERWRRVVTELRGGQG